MNLRQLEILHSVIHTGSTVATARDLSMSQPAVSNAIKSAEISLGFLLFDRVNKRLIPTEEARLLLEQAEPLIRLRDTVKQTAQQLREGRKGRINIVATAELTESLLPRTITAFMRERPEVCVSLDTQRLDTLQEQIETGVADVGFAMEPHPRPTLNLLPLSTVNLICLCPAQSPLCDLPFITPAHLKDVPLIKSGTSSRLYNMVQEVFRRSKAVYAPILDVRFMTVAGMFVKEGLGVTFMDELTASSPRFQDLRSIPFRPHLNVSVCAIVSNRRPIQRLVQSLIDHAHDEVRERLVHSGKSSTIRRGNDPMR